MAAPFHVGLDSTTEMETYVWIAGDRTDPSAGKSEKFGIYVHDCALYTVSCDGTTQSMSEAQAYRKAAWGLDDLKEGARDTLRDRGVEGLMQIKWVDSSLAKEIVGFPQRQG